MDWRCCGYAGRARRSSPVLRWSGIPPSLDESALLEADGATISDDSAGSELLLGLRVKSTGTFDRVGIRIGYEVEGVRYTTFIPAFVRVCATPGKPEASHECAAPSDWLDTERATSDEFQAGPESGQP